MPETSRTGVRDMAALAALYAYGAIKIDGQRCGDRTAPPHHQQQLLSFPGLLDYYRALPADRRERIVEGALMTDRITAARREAAGDVAFVCRGGLEETTYNLRNGTAREMPAVPSQVGRQVVLTGNGRYRPGERPEKEWRPAMATARARLPEAFQILVGGSRAP